MATTVSYNQNSVFNGTVLFKTAIKTITATSYNATLLDAHLVVDDTTASSTVTINLPSLDEVGTGYSLGVKKVGTSYPVILVSTASIDDSLTNYITIKNDFRWVVSNEDQFFIFG